MHGVKLKCAGDCFCCPYPDCIGEPLGGCYTPFEREQQAVRQERRRREREQQKARRAKERADRAAYTAWAVKNGIYYRRDR